MVTPRRRNVMWAGALGALAIVAVVGTMLAWRLSGGGGEISSSTSWPTTSASLDPFPTVPASANPAKPSETTETAPPPTTGETTPAAPTTVTTEPVTARFPSASSTGATTPTESLTEVPSNPYWALDHDLDGVVFTGMIVVSKPGITIRNSRIIATENVAGIWNPKELPGLVIDGVDVVCAGVPPTAAGIAGSNMTVTGSDISGCADGIKAGPGSAIIGNYIHDLGFGEGTHNDGIQIGDGASVEIRGNSIVQVDNGKYQANSAVFVQDTFAAVEGITIVGNYLDGFGFTLRLNGARITNSVVSGNVIGTEHLFGPLLIDGGAEHAANGNRAGGNLRPDGSPID